MAQRIVNISKTPGKIHNTSKTLPRVDPKVLEDAFGVENFVKIEANTSSAYLLVLRKDLLDRLRSEGGRPALSETTRRQKIPLKDEDWQTLVDIASRLASDGLNVAPAQIASVILHRFLHSKKDNILSNLRSDIFDFDREEKFKSIAGHKRVLTLISDEIYFIPLAMEAVLRTAPQERITIEEFNIFLGSTEELIKVGIAHHQVIIRRAQAANRISYSCRIDPPPSDEEIVKGQLVIRIRDNIGREGKVILSTGDSNRVFEMQEPLSDNLTVLAIDVKVVS